MILKAGQYLNQRREVVTLVENSDGRFEKEGTEGAVIYSGTTCLHWNPYQERYFMSTDLKDDLLQYIGPKILH